MNLGNKVLEMIFEHSAPAIALRPPAPKDSSGSLVSYDIVSPGDQVTLATLCLVSRQFRTVGTPILYRRLVCAQPGLLKPHNFALRLSKCLSAHCDSDSTAFAHVQMLSIRYRSAARESAAPDFRALVAACSNMEILHTEGPTIGSLLGDISASGRQPHFPMLTHIMAGPADSAITSTSPFAACLDSSALRSLNLLGCASASFDFLQFKIAWSGLESLGLLAPTTVDLRIDFGSLPSLKHLVLDGHRDWALKGPVDDRLPAVASLLESDSPFTLETVDLTVCTLEDVQSIVRVFAPGGVGRCRCLHVAFPYLLSKLYYGRDLPGADHLYELGKALRVASVAMPFQLLPRTLLSEAESQRRDMNERWGLPAR